MGHFQDKNVGVSLLRGTSNSRVVLDDRDGAIGGYEIAHWDDSQDANVLAQTIRAGMMVDGQLKPRPRRMAATPEEIRIIQDILTRRVNNGV